MCSTAVAEPSKIMPSSWNNPCIAACLNIDRYGTIPPACCMQVLGPVPVAIPGIDDCKLQYKNCYCKTEFDNPTLSGRYDLIPTVGGVTDLIINTNLAEYWSWYPAFWKYTKNTTKLANCDVCDKCNRASSAFTNTGQQPCKCFLRTPLMDQNYYNPKLYQPHPSKFVNCVNPVWGI